MGFFSKIFKGVKKVFKKIGKGIKSAFKSVGKFMGKLGIIGQIGLGLLLPGLGSMLGNFAGTLMSSSSVIAQGAGQFINAAVNVGTKIGSTFKTITQGVTKVIGQTVGTVLNKAGLTDVVGKVGIDISGMKNFTGEGGLFDTAGKVL
jgi:phage-related protein